MDRRVRILLSAGAGLVFLCICGFLSLRLIGQRFLDELIIDDPDEVALIARSFVQYDLPEDYEETGVLDFIFGRMLVIRGNMTKADETGVALISLVQFHDPQNIDSNLIQEQFTQSLNQFTGSGNIQLELVQTLSTVIHDQEVDLLVYEGIDPEGIPIRQVISGIFEGNSGPTMVLILAPINVWDQKLVDDFIASIR